MATGYFNGFFDSVGKSASAELTEALPRESKNLTQDLFSTGFGYARSVYSTIEKAAAAVYKSIAETDLTKELVAEFQPIVQNTINELKLDYADISRSEAPKLKEPEYDIIFRNTLLADKPSVMGSLLSSLKLYAGEALKRARTFNAETFYVPDEFTKLGVIEQTADETSEPETLLGDEADMSVFEYITENTSRRKSHAIFNHKLADKTGLNSRIAEAYKELSAEGVVRYFHNIGVEISAKQVRRVAMEQLGEEAYKTIASKRFEDYRFKPMKASTTSSLTIETEESILDNEKSSAYVAPSPTTKKTYIKPKFEFDGEKILELDKLYEGLDCTNYTAAISDIFNELTRRKETMAQKIQSNTANTKGNGVKTYDNEFLKKLGQLRTSGLDRINYLERLDNLISIYFPNGNGNGKSTDKRRNAPSELENVDGELVKPFLPRVDPFRDIKPAPDFTGPAYDKDDDKPYLYFRQVQRALAEAPAVAQTEGVIRHQHLELNDDLVTSDKETDRRGKITPEKLLEGEL